MVVNGGKSVFHCRMPGCCRTVSEEFVSAQLFSAISSVYIIKFNNDRNFKTSESFLFTVCHINRQHFHSVLANAHPGYTRQAMYVQPNTEARHPACKAHALYYKRHDFREKVTEHKMCVTFSTNYVREKFSFWEEFRDVLSYMSVCRHVM